MEFSVCLGEAGFARLTKKSAVRFDFDSLLLLLLLFLLVLIKSGKKKNRLTKMDSLFAAILILPSSSFFKKECFFFFCIDFTSTFVWMNFYLTAPRTLESLLAGGGKHPPLVTGASVTPPRDRS